MKEKISKINIGIILLSVLVCVISFFTYLINNNNSMALLSIGAMALPFIPYIIEKIFKKKIPYIIKFVFLMAIFLGTIMGSIVDLYDKTNGYDKLVHFSSGILMSFVSVYLLRYICGSTRYIKFIYILLIIIFNIAVAGLWEITEYLYDLILSASAQKGLVDTMQDMICATLGCILFVLIYTDTKSFKLK